MLADTPADEEPPEFVRSPRVVVPYEKRMPKHTQLHINNIKPSKILRQKEHKRSRSTLQTRQDPVTIKVFPKPQFSKVKVLIEKQSRSRLNSDLPNESYFEQNTVPIRRPTFLE